MDWSYRLSDFLLFSPRTYYRQFELLNQALWPWHIAALLGGAALLVLAWRRPPQAGRVAALILAVAFASAGWLYIHLRYATINWAADWLALAFAVEAALLLLSGVVFDRLRFAPARLGPAIIVFGLLVQPLAAPLLGRAWTQAEIFGLAPDPTVTVALGVLLCAARVPWELTLLPLLWCLVAFLTLFTMDAPESWVMLGVGLVALAGFLERRRRHRREGRAIG